LKEYVLAIAAARAAFDAIEVPALVAFRATIATTMAAYDAAVLTATDDPPAHD
jgi:hypothetical protein